MRSLLIVAIALCLSAVGCRGEEIDSTAGNTPNRPKPGTYTYELTVKSLDPDDDGKELQSVTAEQTEKITIDEDVVTSELSTDRAKVVDRVVTKWEDDRILFLSTGTSTGKGFSTCEFEPPITVLEIPIRIGKSAVQKWESKECRGEMTIEVIGPATAPDATGKTWKTWKYEVRETTRVAGTITLVEKRWFSPELGRNIRWERDTRSEQASSRYHHVTQAALKSYPGD